MKASELKPGQFFDWNNQRCLCVCVHEHSVQFAFMPRKGFAAELNLCTLKSEVNPDVPQCWGEEAVSTSKELNIDAGTEQFELARALHRVVRAMHDGHCPKCGHLASSMEFEPSPGYHVCPECLFAITKEESDEALNMFLPYMQKNYDKFVAWQLYGRFVNKQPPVPPKLQLREGAWYKRRDGETVGPAKRINTSYAVPTRFFLVGHRQYPQELHGRQYETHETPYDLIAEVPPPCEPAVKECLTTEFKAGDWVVCVDDERQSPKHLQLGSLYLVREVPTDIYRECDLFVDGHHCSWKKSRFRHATPAEIEQHTQPDSEGWIEHVGNECPFDETQAVEYVLGGNFKAIGLADAGRLDWTSCNMSWCITHYRPVSPQQQWRPFANAEEFKPHRDRWIRRMNQRNETMPGAFSVDAYDDTGLWTMGSRYVFSELVQFVFDDNDQPCGVKQ